MWDVQDSHALCNIDVMTRTPVQGMAVTDIRGIRLGTVGRVDDTRIQLRRDPEGTVWFTPDAIFTIDGGYVSLVCNREELSHYMAEPPQCAG